MPSRYLSFEVDAVLADDLVVDAGLLHLEAGRVDQQVELVLVALEDRALRVDLGDALAVGVDQVDVRAVERRQVVVVEARPLAHEHVPRLQRVGRRLVFDDLVDAAVDPHHVVDVARSPGAGSSPRAMSAATRVYLHRRQQRRRSSRLLRRFACQPGFSFAAHSGSVSQSSRDVDRRRRALEDVQLLRVRAEVRDRPARRLRRCR